MISKKLSAWMTVLVLAATACGSSPDAEVVAGNAEAGAGATSEAETTTANSEAPTTGAPTTTAAPTTTVAPTTTEAPTTTTAAPTTTLAPATPLEAAAGGAANLKGWVVESGRYSTDRLGRPIELTFDEPVTWFDDKGLITLGRSDVSGDQNDVVVVLEPVGIIPAGVVGIHPPHDPPVPINTEPLPESLEGRFAAVPQLSIAGSGAITTGGGDSAAYWDVDVDLDAGETFGCHLGNCVANLVHPDWGAFVFGDNLRFRVYQLDESASGLVVFVQAHSDAFDDTIALSESLVSGMVVTS